MVLGGSRLRAAFLFHGDIRGKWLAMGGPLAFGMPTSDEQNVGVDITLGGRWNSFQYANIYWRLGIGSHEVHGAIRAKYLEYLVSGHPSYGIPLTDEYSSGSDRRNDFDSGFITWNALDGAVVTD